MLAYVLYFQFAFMYLLALVTGLVVYGSDFDSITGWLILRGKAQVVDDSELAALLDDRDLMQRIEEERFWPRLWWGAGFGAAAVAGVTSGLFIAQSKDRDTKTIGISLITLGAISGVMALLFPSIGARHVLAADEAEALCDDYNAKLRTELDITPEQIERFDSRE